MKDQDQDQVDGYKPYDVVVCTTLDELKDAVSGMVAQGFMPTGGPRRMQGSQGAWYQAIWRPVAS